MYKITVCAHPYPPAVFLNIFRCSRTAFLKIERAVTKKAVDVFNIFMARIVQTILVFKEPEAVIHDIFLQP